VHFYATHPARIRSPAFPAAYFAYHAERVQPFADHLSTVILETLVNNEDNVASNFDAES
jgi:hypothetical protein